ncbi:hypothetical protein QVD17_29680 [Tagetes erecta]|uniref:Phospholipase/carboxylesterase/thioesterase domain-containing protein n=1 Tax=Tagetes erecta TaxID=13708 RepID=A0AAD8NMS3_TARER|nr:hypothetical protein QVD17_29680 [Tagetes erecta]
MEISIPIDLTTENHKSLRKTMCRFWFCSSQVFFFLAAVTGCISVIVNMNVTDDHFSSGDLTAVRRFKFGSVYVVEPKGKHQATIVWLHGLGDDGSSWSQVLEALSLPNVSTSL